MPTASKHSLITDKNIAALASKCHATIGFHCIGSVHSPLHPKAWASLLSSGKNWDEDALFILDGVYNGFRVIDPDATIPTYECKNYQSCFNGDNYPKMCAILQNELDAGKVSIAVTKPLQIHSLGAIPKPNGSVRHITDCSLPRLDSVNNFMKNTFSTFSYNTIDDVLPHVHNGSYMTTIDFQDAYRSVPIHPDDRKHFGLQWDFEKDLPIYQIIFCASGVSARPLFSTDSQMLSRAL